MHQLSVCLLALALSSASVEAQLGFGPCPDQPVVDNFDTTKYKGDWYEYSKYLSPDQAVTRCTKVTYTPNGQLIDVEQETLALDQKIPLKGQLKKANPANTDAKFTLRLGESPFAGQENDETEVNYQVLDTDYTSYAVVYNCQDFFPAHITNVNVYTRSRDAVQTDTDAVYLKLRNRGIDTRNLAKTNQENCDN